MSAVATKVAIVALAAIICVCGGSICYMGKQPDPDHPELGLRWVLPYSKEVLCTCTKILFGGTNMEPPPGSDNFFYPDDPMSLVNNDDAEDLWAKLKCVEKDLKAKVRATNHQSTRKSLPASLSSSTSSPPTKAKSTTGASPATVVSSTSSTPTKAESTTGSSPATIASSTSSPPTKAQSTTGSSPATVASSTKAKSTAEPSSTTKPLSTTVLSTTPSPATTSSTTENPQGVDCEDILDQGHSNNGVYTLSPAFINGGSLDVLCDMKNGGWILIQQRFDGSVNFNQDWTSYRQGFGTPPGEYWLGLHIIRRFTNSGGTWKLRVDLEDWHGHTGYAEYSEFKLEGADYELIIDGYTGNIGDAMEYHDEKQFSTHERDNSDDDCASAFQSGWWFGNCHDANLNGVYFPIYAVEHNHGIQWETWTTYHEYFDMDYYSMKSASMKIKKVE